jgi:hypothetical protein
MLRRWFPLWLVVCVLVSQTALARHVVSHTTSALAVATSAASPGQHGRHDGDGDGDRVCEQCLAFIAVDVALPTLPVIAALPESRQWHFPSRTPVRMRSVSRGPTRNRDPPCRSASSV